MVPMDPLWLVAFFEQCQTDDKAAGIFDKLKEKKQPKAKKTAHPSVACSMVRITSTIVAKAMTITEAIDAITMNANTTVVTKMINAMITLVAMRRTSRKSPSRKKMIANVITSKRRKWSCTMIIPPLFEWTLCLEKGVALSQGFLLNLAPVLALAQAAAKGAIKIIMLPMMITNKAVPSSVSNCTQTMRTMDCTFRKKRIAFLPHLPPQKGRRKGVAPCRQQRQQSNLFVSHLAFFQIWNLIC